MLLGYEPTKMLCLPIKSFMTSTIKRMFSSPLRSMSSSTEQTLGVAVACNKLDGTAWVIQCVDLLPLYWSTSINFVKLVTCVSLLFLKFC